MVEKTRIEKLKEKREKLKRKIFSGGTLGEIEEIVEEIVDQAIEHDEEIINLKARVAALEGSV